VSESVWCPNGHAVAPGSSFCSTCGVGINLLPPPPATIVEQKRTPASAFLANTGTAHRLLLVASGSIVIGTFLPVQTIHAHPDVAATLPIAWRLAAWLSAAGIVMWVLIDGRYGPVVESAMLRKHTDRKFGPCLLLAWTGAALLLLFGGMGEAIDATYEEQLRVPRTGQGLDGNSLSRGYFLVLGGALAAVLVAAVLCRRSSRIEHRSLAPPPTSSPSPPGDEFQVPTVHSNGVAGTQQNGRKWIWLGAFLILVAVGFVATRQGESDKLTPIARMTCANLQDARLIQVSDIVGLGVRTAREAGYSPSELGDSMREICPATMAAVRASGMPFTDVLFSE
jgi:hypothetical protein